MSFIRAGKGDVVEQSLLPQSLAKGYDLRKQQGAKMKTNEIRSEYSRSFKHITSVTMLMERQ